MGPLIHRGYTIYEVFMYYFSWNTYHSPVFFCTLISWWGKSQQAFAISVAVLNDNLSDSPTHAGWLFRLTSITGAMPVILSFYSNGLFFQLFSTHHINHTDTIPTIHYSYALHFITALVSLSLTFKFHAQTVELYYQCTFSKVNYSLKSSRLQIFIHKYFSWFRTIKISKIGESLLSRMSKMKHIT